MRDYRERVILEREEGQRGEVKKQLREKEEKLIAFKREEWRKEAQKRV